MASRYEIHLGKFRTEKKVGIDLAQSKPRTVLESKTVISDHFHYTDIELIENEAKKKIKYDLFNYLEPYIKFSVTYNEHVRGSVVTGRIDFSELR